MSAQLQVISPGSIPLSDRPVIDTGVGTIIEASKDNRHAVNLLVTESLDALLAASEQAREISRKRAPRVFFRSITAGSRKLHAAINSSLDHAQYTAQRLLQKLADENAMSFDLITSVNNRLEHSLISGNSPFANVYDTKAHLAALTSEMIEQLGNGGVSQLEKVHDAHGQKSALISPRADRLAIAVGTGIHKIYEGTVQFFRQTKSNLIKTDTKRTNLNPDVVSWQGSLEYHIFDAYEAPYPELSDLAKLVVLARDFYDVTQGNWSTKDLLLLKNAMTAIKLDPQSRMSYSQLFEGISESKPLRHYLLQGKDFVHSPDPHLITLSGLAKLEELDGSEFYLIEVIQEVLDRKNALAPVDELRLDLARAYLRQASLVDPQADVNAFDLLIELLFNMYEADRSGLLDPGAVEPNEPIGRRLAMAEEVFADVSGETERDLRNLGDVYVAARQGDAAAQYEVGVSLLHGDKVAEDEQAAARWLKKAADQNDPRAQYELGCLYCYGRGVPEEKARAFRLFLGAAALGNTDAKYMAGRCCHYGWGTEKNEREALRWYEQAADAGNADAMYQLGYAYCYGRGLTRDVWEAARWFSDAARRGNIDSQYQLGLCYMNGWGVARNSVEAKYWFTKAAENGSAAARDRLKQYWG